MKKSFARLSVIILIVFIIIYIVYQFGFSHHLTLKNLKEQSLYLAQWVSKNYVLSVALYMILYFIVIASSIPSTGPMSMIGGFLFGTFRSVVYATISATAGATLSFLLFRSVFRRSVHEKYVQRVAMVRAGIDEYGGFYLLILHFLFILPFVVINALAALANVSLWRFVWTTAIGFLPAAIIYGFAGQQIRTIESTSDIFSFKIIGSLGLLVLFIVLIILCKRYKKIGGM